MDFNHLFDAYSIITGIFPRFLGFIYFVAFGAFLLQVKGLIGVRGILPAQRYLSQIKMIAGKKRFYYAPTLFWLNASNKMLIAVLIFSLMIAVLLMLNIVTPLCLLLLFIIQLSIVTIGQDFLSFGWELFLLEITCNTFFLTLSPIPNPLLFISLNLLLFRFHFQGGISKILSKDNTWRTLTALQYHYQTQPLPNTLAWYAYHLPLWFHKLSTAMMFFIEMIVPFGIFAPQEIRLAVFFFFFGLQYFIWLTGNFSYLNHLTVLFSTILISNTYLKPLIGNVQSFESVHPLLNGFLYLVGAILIVLQCISLRHYFKPSKSLKKILDTIYPFHIINRYGIFAIMTTQRIEVVIEGSMDGENWEEYLFKFKPSEINRRPRRISPYQPRLDWMAWFLPFSSFEDEAWFQNFLFHILKGTPDVLKLLRHNPFPESPPHYVRALIYDYQFSSSKLKKATGNWWKRRLIGYYSPILHLQT